MAFAAVGLSNEFMLRNDSDTVTDFECIPLNMFVLFR